MPVGSSEELSAEVETEAFSVITDVIGLDTTKYTVEPNYSSETDNGIFREYVSYTLEADESKIDVLLTFYNNILIQWCVYPLVGSPLYAEPLPTKTLDITKDTLQRYQSYANIPVVQEARNVLDTITELKPADTTIGDLKMEVTEGDGYTKIHWVQTINGLDFTTGLSIRLANGIVDTLTDRSSFFKIGSADVNISQEEAVKIGLEETKTFTSLNIWTGDKEEIVPFHVNEKPQIVRLQVGTAENFTMYPCWYVWFVADPEVYSTTGVEVSIRADTGEISYSRPTTYYGVLDPDTPADTTPDPSTSPDSQSEGDPNQPIVAYVIAGTITTAIAVAIATVTLKKRSK